jgi:hypothetical protein
VAIPTVLNTLKAKKARMLTVIALGASLASASLDADTVSLKYADGFEETAVLPL